MSANHNMAMGEQCEVEGIHAVLPEEIKLGWQIALKSRGRIVDGGGGGAVPHDPRTSTGARPGDWGPLT